MKRVFVFVLLALLLLQGAFALDIAIYSPEKGTTVDSRATYVFQVMGEMEKNATCSLFFNKVKHATFDVKTNEQVAYTQLTPMGMINWSVSCTLNGETKESTPRPIIIMDVSAPAITIHQPINQSLFADETLFINVSIDDSSAVQATVELQHLNLTLNRTKELDFDKGYYVEAIPISKELVSGNYLITIIARDVANRTTNKTTTVTIHSLYIINLTQPQAVEEKKPVVLSGTVADDTGVPVKNKQIELTLPNNERVTVLVTDGAFFYTLDTTGMQSGPVVATLHENGRDFVGSTPVTITPLPKPVSEPVQEQVQKQAEVITQQVAEVKEAVQLQKFEETVKQEIITQEPAQEKKEVSSPSTKTYLVILAVLVILIIGFGVHHKKNQSFDADLATYLNRRRKM